MKRTVLLITGVILLLIIFFNHQLIHYGYKQASGQFKVLLQARPVEEFLNDPQFPDSLKARIHLVDEIKQFSVKELSLAESESYQKIFDQKGRDILWVITACEPFKLVAKEWSFPFIGTFSYKGFFDPDMALTEKEKLDKEGFDTGIRTAGAWSTLGILNDPIMSDMLNRSEGDLAEVIIHELTHGTIFVKDSLEFNENLASFIGEKGAIKFLEFKYGKDSEALQRYKYDLYDHEIFNKFVINAAKALDEFYCQLSEDWDKELKKTKKEEKIGAIINHYDTLIFSEKSGYPRYFIDYYPNNTFFMSFLRYRGKQTELDSILRNHYEDDIKSFIEGMKLKYSN